MRSTGVMNGTGKDGVLKIRRKPGRVPTSCAECRRLKLRCDKNVPCEKCVSRGCGSICPDGSLTPGRGNRLILANTEELHDRIDHLCSRIRELENALRTLQESVSDEPHPLLQNDLSQPIASRAFRPPPAPTSVAQAPRNTSSHPEEPPDQLRSHSTQADDENFVDAFGTLTLGRRGQCSFFGKTARSEYLIRALAHQQFRTNVAPSRLSKQLTERSYPDPEICDPALGREIFSSLPPLSEAIHLCEIYQEHGKFMYTPIPRTELFDEILASVYRTDSFEAVPCHHSLSLLLIVFALAALFDPDKQPYSIEAQEFYHLSRAALRFDPQTTRISIQALIHLAQYLDFSDWDSMGSSISWLFVGHAVRLGHSAGLHLNSARWELSEPNIQRRCRLFWQLFHLDTWASFFFGRPPTMSAAYIDCPIPKDHNEASIADQGTLGSFHAWNWQYTALLHSIMATAFGAKQPTYTVVLSLDRRVRDFPIPPHWRPVCDTMEESIPVELHVQRWIVLSSKEITLLNLHRAYFAQALQEMPMELARHPYIPSVIAIYRSAWRLIEGLRLVWRTASHPISRTSLPWSHALSAAIVMCLLITRAPTSNMASSALTELDHLLELFQNAAPNARAAANVLDSIVNLHRKAHDVMDNGATHGTVSCPPSDAELDRLGGKTHLLAEVGAPDSGAGGPSASVALTNVATGPGSGYYFSDAQVDNMHPTLAQDMRSFDGGAPTFNHFFDSPAAPYLPSMPDLNAAHDTNFYLSAEYQPYHHHHQPPPPPPPQAPFEQAAPILDATWQSFVEQLGF
ncbi:hypothetical protein D9615_000960 [Tricholomella constricta]|uniref:Zn(2)-C6 fungal-type domain-containing protein n=1 Tax=Tricholomella constricta TaxID=117010 RepID=A0A8H5M863_9AGAR|nr:hypothetical protein D9615_000960 [Tricholomella constricta]